MSRPPAALPAGLAALWEAVAEARRRERGRHWSPWPAGLRVLAVAGGPADDMLLRAVVPARAGGTQSTAAEPSRAQVMGVPVPSAAGDDAGSPQAPHAPAEGDAAVALRLVERVQGGDAEAFGELYDRYVDVVFRYISYRVGSRQLAEDLTSETFLRALRRISSFTWQGRDVGAWFVTIARNLIADHYKSSRYRLELTTDDMTTVGTSGAGAAPGVRTVEDSPEQAVLDSMQNKVLLDAVRKLGAEQQECIALRFLQGLSVAETAAVMGKNEGAIKALQYRAVRSLGRLLPEGVEL